jgi:hypothetical protein
MGFWREALPEGKMIEVRYEDVVADLEGQGRRILDHCGGEACGQPVSLKYASPSTIVPSVAHTDTKDI